jgi:hypothetical protein
MYEESEMWIAIYRLGIPKKLVEICRAIGGEIFASVKVGKEV